MDAELGAVHGIGYTDFLILAEISSVVGHRLRAVDLAKRLMLTPSGVTRALGPLSKIGLVQRAAHDRDARASYVSLTADGERKLAETLPTAERIVAEAFDSALTPAARLTVLGFFERLGYASPGAR
ncbi:MAG TPA: MarR family transcriptional regulator [Candidatus Baltobacteraceae bacterium]